MNCRPGSLRKGGLLWVCVWFFSSSLALAHPDDVPRRHYVLANKDEVIGGSYYRHRVTRDDTMILLARDNRLGFNEIMLANPAQDPWNPKVGSKIRLDFRKVLPGLNNPARIVVNLPEMRLYHFRGSAVDTYPVGVGQEGMMTPRVRTTVTHKMADPIWRPPASIRKENPSLPEAVYPGPNNPLGSHAIYFALPSYLMHGTNRPLGVGRRVSHGCIRLYPEDIVDLFPNVQAGDTVAFVNEPVKAGWRGEELFLEVYPPLSELKKEGSLESLMQKAISQALARRPTFQSIVDWRLAERMVAYPDGQSRRVAISASSTQNSSSLQDDQTIPEVPEEQTISENGLILPDLDRLDRDEDDAAQRAAQLAAPESPPEAPVTDTGGTSVLEWTMEPGGLVPDRAMPGLAPDTATSDAVPDTATPGLAPDTATSDAVPDTAKPGLAPDTATSDAVPDTAKPGLAPDTATSGTLPDAAQPASSAPDASVSDPPPLSASPDAATDQASGTLPEVLPEFLPEDFAPLPAPVSESAPEPAPALVPESTPAKDPKPLQPEPGPF
ncbi:MAG: L,D-transpeptidase family protein [Magnetococcus sp. YQC-5]